MRRSTPSCAQARSATSAARTTRAGSCSRRWASSDRLGYQRFVSQQIYYSLQAREAEYELIPAGLDQGVGVLVWSPLAGGLLSGKYRRGQGAPEGTRRLAGWDEPPVRDEDQLYDTVDVLVEIADARGVSPAQVALAWLLRKPAVTSLVIGARTDEQLADNLRAADLRPDRRRAGSAGRGQRPAAALSVLAPGGDGRRPPGRRRSLAARPTRTRGSREGLLGQCRWNDNGVMEGKRRSYGHDWTSSFAGDVSRRRMP